MKMAEINVSNIGVMSIGIVWSSKMAYAPGLSEVGDFPIVRP